MRKRIIRLNIKLTPKQREVDSSKARFKVLKWARRVGKTWYEAFSLGKWGLQKPRGKFWYVTKTLNLGREEFIPALLNLLPRDCIAKLDERLMNVKLTNGSTVSVKSGEKEDNLRGRGLDGLVLDEAAFLKERIFDQILRPQLGHSKGPALIASSPKKGWFTRLFNEAAKGTDPNWFASHATIYDSSLDPEEIAVIKAKTPVGTWLQEYMAEEQANIGQVYEEFTKANIYNPDEKFIGADKCSFVRGIDWGKEAHTGVAWVGVSKEGHLFVHDIHRQSNWDVNRHAPVIHSKSAGLHIVETTLDRSAYRVEGAATMSIAKSFSNEGIHCQPSEKDVMSSVDIVKRFLRGDGVTPWLYVSSNCAAAINDFQDWEHEQHEPDLLAAIRYAVVRAVRRRLTHLADFVPTPRLVDPIRGMDDAALLASRARIRNKPSGARWNWDHAAGRPC